MDDEAKLQVVDWLLERTRASALESLTARINVEQELSELYSDIGMDPDITVAHDGKPR
jgi:hypothetical protein